MVASKSVAGHTRDALILAAERLFAEHGLDAVSLRQINAAAGQRNSSAAHYHFGSRDALVAAICDYRMQRVNRRRTHRLEQLQAAGRERDPRALIEAVIYPVVDEIDNSEGGHYYIRFLAQAVGHPRIDLGDLWASAYGNALVQVFALLRACLSKIPAGILGQRFGLMWEQAIHALADRERLSDRGQAREPVSKALFVSNLVDMVAAGLAAPVSPATRDALKAEAGSAEHHNPAAPGLAES